MNKFIAFMEKYFIPVATKIGNQRHLLAIRDGFVTTMPIIIMGSLGALINNFPIDAYQNFMNNIFGEEVWKSFGNNLSNGSFAIMALMATFAISYSLAKSYNSDAISAGIVGVSSFFSIGGLNGLGSTGLFLALIVSLLSTEIFRRLVKNERLVIKMPDGVPPAVAKSFTALFPAIITVSIFAFFTTILFSLGVKDIVGEFFNLVQEPFMGLANTYPVALLLTCVATILWFFGLHGPNIIDPFMQTINVPAILENAKALEAGKAAPYIVNKPFFDSFVLLGGTGATIGLALAIFIVGRNNKQYYTVAKLGIAPSLFNINEPLLFGIPTVLNPIMFIPFIFTPIILVTVAYFATSTGLVPACTIATPWTTPPIIGGLLATQSWRGGLLSLVNLVISVLMYIPFVRIATIQQRAEQEALNNHD